MKQPLHMREVFLLLISAVLLFASCGKKEAPPVSSRELRAACVGSFAEIPPVPGIDWPLELTVVPARLGADAGHLARAWSSVAEKVGLEVAAPARGWSGAVQRDSSGRPVFAGENPLPLPDSLLAVATAAQVTRYPDADAFVLDSPVFSALAGYSREFRALIRDWKNPADSTGAWWHVARFKQQLLVRWLRQAAAQIRTSASSDSAGILLRATDPLSAAGENVIVPGYAAASAASLDGFVAALPVPDEARRWNYQGVMRARPFEQTFLSASWWLNLPGSASVWLELPALSEKDFWHAATALLMQPAAKNFLPFRLTGNRLSPQWGVFSFLAKQLASHPARLVEYPWPRSGVLISDTYMWMRGAPWRCDLESLTQLALPLLNHGVPVELVPIERLQEPHFLDRYQVLLTSFEGYRPASGSFQRPLERWLRSRGGILIFYLGVTGPFDEVNAWWSKDFDRPHEPLFQRLGIGLYPESGLHKIGRGIVYAEVSSPRELAPMPNSGDIIWNTFLGILDFLQPDSAREKARPAIAIQRGPYYLVWNPEELAKRHNYALDGNWLDVLAPNFPLVADPEIPPGEAGIFVNLDSLSADTAFVCAASAPVASFARDSLGIAFELRWATSLPVQAVVRLPHRPADVTARSTGGEELPLEQNWDGAFQLLRLRFLPAANRTRIRIHFRHPS